MLIKNRMHPKNIYKNPPDFKKLAIEYPEFRKYVKQKLSGKVTIDYQDRNAVKELTRTLLKKDFNLNVEINEFRLIPRIPLCLNYILWVEDLLGSIEKERPFFGIDIGTGCVCIYSLLAARKGWKMLATEIDIENLKSAQKNVNKNNLDDVITVKLVSESDQLLIGVLDEKTVYDFCMCNPPFFNFNEKPQNRTARRPHLESVASNIATEISVEGGEIFFINKLVKESLQLKSQVKIYTTLIGKKSDFLLIKKEIQKISPKSIAFTEFYQGKTVRWGVAWSFLDIDLNNKVHHVNKTKKTKSKPPLKFTLLKSTSESLNTVFEDATKVFNDLKISFREEISDVGYMLYFKAYENTWSHQRQKKRLKEKSNKTSKEQEAMQSSSIDYVVKDDCPMTKKLKLDLEITKQFSVNDKSLIVEGLMCLKKESSIIVEMSWISGNKESLHQIFQYFKNYWFKANNNI